MHLACDARLQVERLRSLKDSQEQEGGAELAAALVKAVAAQEAARQLEAGVAQLKARNMQLEQAGKLRDREVHGGVGLGGELPWLPALTCVAQPARVLQVGD